MKSFQNTMSTMGIECRFVDPADPENFRRTSDAKTRCYYGETLPNPKLTVFPIAEVAKIGAGAVQLPAWVGGRPRGGRAGLRMGGARRGRRRGALQPDGSLDEVINMPAGFVSSISFGGPDLRDVLISTADNRVEPELGGTLLRARSDVPGLALAPALPVSSRPARV